ncbi:MAG: cobalt-precorrin-6A reductase [Thermosynechococcaceae cyanobacterium]
MPNSNNRGDNFALKKESKDPKVSGSLSPRIWLIGGTSEGLALARLIIQASLPCTVSVTTASAECRYPRDAAVLKVQIQQFTPQALSTFLRAEKIAVILDASHPHAAEISTLAMQAADANDIPYLRFERPAVDSHPDCVHSVETLASVLCEQYLLNRRVLLTLGAKALSQFRPWQSRSTLFARILPSQVALQAAIEAGFAPECLIALRPPISMGMERALWRQWRIDLVITKASGQPGGEGIKRQVAAALQVDLIVIQRPRLVYPQQTSDMEDAIAFCQKTLTQRRSPIQLPPTDEAQRPE